MKDDEPKLPPAASVRDGVEVWDLRERPTAEQVGIADGSETATYEPEKARTVELTLPEDESVRLPDTRYVSFSAILSSDDRPDSWEVHTTLLETDPLVTELRSLAEQVGGGPDVANDFARQIDSAQGTDRVSSDRVEAKFGDLKLGVFARYYPNSGKGLVVINGGWH